MNWSEFFSLILLVSNVMYACFRVVDYFHERKIHQTMANVEIQQAEIIKKLAENINTLKG